MHALKWIGIGYLALSFIVLVVLFVWLLLDDLRLYRDPLARSVSKFGYSLLPTSARRWGIGWFILFLGLPGVNLIVLMMIWPPVIIRAVREWWASIVNPEWPAK